MWDFRFVEIAERVVALAAVALLALLILSMMSSLGAGTDDLNMLAVFNIDERRAVKKLLENLAADDLDPRGFFNYGYVYHGSAWWIVRTLEGMGYAADARLVAGVFRGISVISYAALAWLMTRMWAALGVEGSGLRWVGALGVVGISGYYRWGQLVHPDLLQTALVVSAATIALRWQHGAGAIAAAAVAGIAFGTKYSGIFLLPFLFLPSFLRAAAEGALDSARRWVTQFAVGIAMNAVFLASWLASNPYAWAQREALRDDLVAETHHVGRGDGRAEPTDPTLWFVLIVEELGRPAAALLTVGLVAAVVSLALTWRRAGWRAALAQPATRGALTLLLYVIAAGGYLMLRVNMRRIRYAMHVLPFAVALGFVGLAWLRGLAPGRLRWAAAPTALAALLPMLGATLESGKAASRRYETPAVQIGQHLGVTYPAETRVLADRYTYVPARFRDARSVSSNHMRVYENFKPDVIVLNARNSAGACWRRAGTRFQDGELVQGDTDKAATSCAFQRRLLRPCSGWKTAYEDRWAIVLERESEDSCDLTATF